ncbi:MAG: hypothetical protein AAAC47_01985 [Pararhizobium sp.]
MTTWVKYEREHDTEYRSFQAFVLSRHSEPGSSTAAVLERLCEADLPPRAIAWDFIEQHLVDRGWSEESLRVAHRIHDRYMNKGQRRHKLRRSNPSAWEGLAQ